MNGLIARLATWLRRTRGDAVITAPNSSDGSGELDRRELARRLTAELDAALQQGKLTLANRLAESAMLIASAHPHLCDRIARLRLMQGDSETALRIIESCIWQSASLRLLRSICLVSLGRRHEAHLDLQAWSRRAAAPLRARQLLALLDCTIGDEQSAIQALQRNLRQLEDPATLSTLALIGMAQGRFEWVGRWIERLNAVVTHDRSADLMELAMSTIDRPAAGHPAQAALERRIAMLAGELAANEQVIPVLVESQRLQPDAEAIALLVAGIEHALPRFEQPEAAIQALEALQAIASRAQEFVVEPRATVVAAESDVLATIGPEESIARERAA